MTVLFTLRVYYIRDPALNVETEEINWFRDFTEERLAEFLANWLIIEKALAYELSEQRLTTLKFDLEINFLEPVKNINIEKLDIDGSQQI